MSAAGVILSHSVLLSGDLENGSAWALGYISVNCFFIISGFLVTASLLNRGDLARYALARALRVFPGLIVCVVACILAVGLFSAQQNLVHFLLTPQTLEFWLKNSLLILGELKISLPTEIFENNPVRNQVNAPLWTLQYEILMYFLLVVLYMMTIIISGKDRQKGLLIPVVLVGAVSMTLFLANVTQAQPTRGVVANLLRFGAMFFYGSAFYLLRDKIRFNQPVLLTICLLFVLAFVRRELLICAVYLSLGYLLLYVAYVPSGRIRLFNQLGDYSYGLYIYAFPIQQFYVHFHPSIGPAALLLATLVTTLPVAMISWHWIERPVLDLKQ